jgi:hypothetical protein
MPRRDVTANWVRERQFDPKKCARNSFRTIERGKGKRRRKIVVCCPAGKFKQPGYCTVGMKAQSILTPRRKRKRGHRK